ncbi:MAG: hypothetical protein ACO1OB_26760 [Archangium sp.]
MRSASTFGYLVVLSVLAWAAMPLWGSSAVLAVLLLLAIATRRMIHAARTTLEPHFEILGVTDEAGRDFIRRHALTFLWPDAAKRWTKPWVILGPLAIFLALAFIGRAVLTWNPWVLLLLLPTALLLLLGGSMARFFDVDERLTTDLAGFKATWDQAMTRASLRRISRAWPPSEAPDEPPAPPVLP